MQFQHLPDLKANINVTSVVRLMPIYVCVPRQLSHQLTYLVLLRVHLPLMHYTHEHIARDVTVDDSQRLHQCTGS